MIHMTLIHMASAVHTPPDRMLLIVEIVGWILAAVVFMVLCVVAVALCIFIGPALLVVSLFGWIFGAPWAGSLAAGAAVITVVGIFGLAMDS
jgi:hypothetical protein